MNTAPEISPEISPELKAAKELHGKGDLAQAASLYQTIIASDPTNSEASHFLGIALYQQGKMALADPLLIESLVRQPNNVEWWNNYGNILTAQDRLDAAEAAFSRVTSLRPDSAEAWANLGSVQQRRGDLAGAEKSYREAVRIHPSGIVGLKLLGTLLQQENRTMEGAQFLAQAFILEPDAAKTPLDIAKAWLIQNRTDKAAEVYAQLLVQKPDDPTARFLHAACTGIDVPTACSKAYIETTFDSYASTFDSVQSGLGYRGAEMLAEILAAITPAPKPRDILDLGCGTGMCAKILAPLARQLIGVDLSTNMLARASERHAYTELVNADIVEYMEQHPASFDLLTSAECFIYLGKLEPVFAAMAKTLRPGGTAIFTIESLVDSRAPYILRSVGRYCHTQEYVMSLVMQYGFEVAKINPGVLRTELCLPVHGYMWAIRKDAASL